MARVLLLHGLGGTGSNDAAGGRRAERAGHTAFAPTLPGHGGDADRPAHGRLG